MQRDEVEHVLRAACAIAASKCAASREKDAVFVKVLLRNRLIALDVLLERIEMLPIETKARQSVADWARRRAAEAQAS